MELQPISSGGTEIFQLQIPYGRPTARNLFFSLCVHAGIVTALFTISLPNPTPDVQATERLSPTELRLDGHLYYVSKIPASTQKADPSKLTLPRAAQSGRTAAPAAPKQAPPGDLPKPPELTIKAQVPATASPTAEIAATRQLVRRELARTFVPPEVKRDRTATQTLIQPLSPPDLIPKPTPLPSFRMVSPQLPKIPKPFVAPGRKTPTPPAQVPNVPLPNEDLVHADPVLADLQPKLPLPRTPPPPEPAPSKVEGPPPAPQGDAANILSISDRPVPMDKSVVVPAGNIAQESADGASAQPGANAGGANASGANTGTPAPANSTNPARAAAGPNAGSPVATAQGAGRGTRQGTTPGITTGTTPGTTAGTTTVTPLGTNPSASANNGTGAGGSGASQSGPGRGSVGTGIGAALAGASATGSVTLLAGSTNPNNVPNIPGPIGAGAGGGAGNGRSAAGQVISRPPGGTYDAVVIQSSPVDQYPETKGMLSGRPIYSVYFSVGAARDWTLYFCVPNEKPSGTNGPVVQIGPPPTPLGAPYPYKLVRPPVTLPSFEKYVLVHGYVTVDGKFQDIRVVREILPETDRAILASLADWEFRAATRDGVPVRVEFLLSIPAKGL